GGAGDDVLFAAPGGTALLSGGDGFDVVTYAYFQTTGVFVNLPDTTLNAGGAAGHTYQGVEEFILTGYDDGFIGSGAGDTVYASFGDDDIAGGGGDDVLSGDAGADSLLGDAGNDVLDGGSGFDQLFGGDGNDILRGGQPSNPSGEPANSDFLYGGN